MAQLVCLDGLRQGLVFDIENDEVVLGRGVMNTIVLPHHSISRKHAVIKRNGSQFTLEDLRSLNGTQVNNKPVTSSILNPGDIIALGQVVLKFNVEEEPVAEIPAESIPPVVKLICQDGMEKGFEIAIEDKSVTIGRDESNTIKLYHRSISSNHCRLTIENQGVFLEDLDSTNGSIVNGHAIKKKEVVDQDEIELGDLRFIISIQQPAEKVEENLVRPDSQVRVVTRMYGEDFASVEESTPEDALLQSIIQSRQPDVPEAIEETREIAEKPFLDRILSLEWERQKLYLLHEASKTLMSFQKKNEYQKHLASIAAKLFSYKNLILLSGDPLDKAALAQKGNIAITTINEFLAKQSIEEYTALLIDLELAEYEELQSAGAGINALVMPIVINGKKAGIFYLDFEQKVSPEECQIFEMFSEILSVAMKNIKRVR